MKKCVLFSILLCFCSVSAIVAQVNKEKREITEFIDVEADSANGLPIFQMVGYLSSEVKEAGERVRTAIRNAGIMLPAKKMTVNLSPASVRKRGTMFDLPIAIALLCSLGEMRQESLKEILIPNSVTHIDEYAFSRCIG